MDTYPFLFAEDSWQSILNEGVKSHGNTDALSAYGIKRCPPPFIYRL